MALITLVSGTQPNGYLTNYPTADRPIWRELPGIAQQWFFVAEVIRSERRPLEPVRYSYDPGSPDRLDEICIYTAEVPDGTEVVEHATGFGPTWMARLPDGSLRRAADFAASAIEVL